MPKIISLEYLDHNSERSYPFAQDVTRIDTTGTIELPTNFLVDAGLSVNYSMITDPSKFYVREVAIFSTGVSITIAYAATSGSIDVANATISQSDFEDWSVYALSGLGTFSDSTGFVVIGSLSDLLALGSGVFQFSATTGSLEVAVIRPQIQSLNGIRVVSGGVTSEIITGDVELVSGRNCQFVPVYADGVTKIRIDFIDGAGTTEDCVCDPGATPRGEPIRTINNVKPDANGNLTLSPGDCTELAPIQYGLTIKDLCSAPCCTDEEMDIVSADIEGILSKVRTMEDQLSRYESAIMSMENTLLATSLNDRSPGCSSE